MINKLWLSTKTMTEVGNSVRWEKHGGMFLQQMSLMDAKLRVVKFVAAAYNT